METVLLVGFPNSGKSTIFNLLSGKTRKVTNYSGVTVDKGTAELKSNGNYDQKIQIVDLPGIYNLGPNSIDEAITVNSLIFQDKYKMVAAVLDIDRLEASLSLALSLKEIIGNRLILLINKDDQKKIGNDSRTKLEESTGLRVLCLSARFNDERELDRFIRDNIKTESDLIKDQKNYTNIKLSEESFQFFNQTKEELIQNNVDIISPNELTSKLKSFHVEARNLLNKIFEKNINSSTFTEKLDSILLHPIFGSMIFVVIFYFLFLSLYQWSGPPMDIIDGSIGDFGSWISTKIQPGLLNSLIVDGMIAGVGAVIIFLPQIMILFFLLNLLEQSGYIARAAVLTDKVMSIFGLNGKAFLPYLSGFACSIPGIMAARTIPDKKERLATIMTIPLITCAARLPVYILLIGTFVPDSKIFGLFNAQALSFFFLYFLGSFFALIIAKVFRLSFFRGKTNSFFMDLPHYQRPSIRLALIQAWSRGKIFLKKAGTIILALSIVIWFASTYPTPDSSAVNNLSQKEISSYTLQNSYMGAVGKTIEPIIKPIGMDWKMGVGLLAAFGARELFVSTMGTIYALGDVDEESNTLRQRLLNERDPITNRPVYSLATAWSLLIFFVFAMQCMSTLAVLKRETGSWAMPITATVYMGALAYGGAFIAYKLLS
jgi:ferrous iron transport protein B